MFLALQSSVQAAIDGGRIGTPVAVRVVSHNVAQLGRLESGLADVLATATGWLHSSIDRIAALGSAEYGQVSALARCQGGQTVLASIGGCKSSPPLFELTVVGTRGVLNWLPDVGGAVQPAHQTATENLSQAAKEILPLVRAAIERGEVLDAIGKITPNTEPKALPQSEVLFPTEFAPAAPLTAKPWGVLLVGGSHTHQENYAAAFAADRRCRLIGLTDEANVTPRRRELNQRLANELKIPLLPDLAAALARDDAQIVSICAEPERRARIILQAAAAGKHLYLDKPLAASAVEADAIVKAVSQAGVRSHMFNLSHSAASMRARRLAESGELGALKAVHCDLFFAKGRGGGASLAPRQESLSPTAFEGIEAKREFYNVGVYPAALLHCLFKQAPKRVFAVTGNYFFAEHQRHDMEDFGAVLLEYADGTVATIMAGRTGWRSHPASGLNRTCLVGERGAASIDAFRPRIEVWSDEPAWAAPSKHPDDPMGFWSSTQTESGVTPKRDWFIPGDAGPADAVYFLDCLEQNRDSDVPAAAAAEVLRLLLASYRSAATGQFIG